MSEDLQEDVKQPESHDEQVAESSTATEVEGNTEASAAETPEEAKKPNKVQERINQLTREKYEERKQREELEQRLKSLEEKAASQTVKPEIKAPSEDDFDTFAEYTQANAEYLAKVAADSAYSRLTEEQQQKEQKSQADARNQELVAKQTKFHEQIAAKSEHFENATEVILGDGIAPFLDAEIAEIIFDSPKGVEVAYHLGTHLDEAEKIHSLPPLQRARELALLEARLETIQPKKVSDAPDPITPLRGSSSVEIDPDKMTADEWQQWEYERMRAKGK
jgi:hypothetical protein